MKLKPQRHLYSFYQIVLHVCSNVEEALHRPLLNLSSDTRGCWTVLGIDLVYCKSASGFICCTNLASTVFKQTQFVPAERSLQFSVRIQFCNNRTVFIVFEYFVVFWNLSSTHCLVSNRRVWLRTYLIHVVLCLTVRSDYAPTATCCLVYDITLAPK